MKNPMNIPDPERHFQTAKDEERSNSERLVYRRLADDNQHWIVIERWLDWQVYPPRWRSKNYRLRLTNSETSGYWRRPGRKNGAGGRAGGDDQLHVIVILPALRAPLVSASSSKIRTVFGGMP